MQVDVHPSDAEALDAAAALAAECLCGVSGTARVIIAGGRAGRGLMVALAARGDLPWDRTEWFLADERCGDADDRSAHAPIARDALFGPRGVAATRIHAPTRDDGDAADIARRYGAEVATAGGFDLALLPIGSDGALGALAPESAALGETAPVAVVPGSPACVTVTPALLAQARRVIVTAIGPDVAGAVTRALRDGRGPASRLLPSERVTWIVDRDAAAVLLADATPVPD